MSAVTLEDHTLPLPPKRFLRVFAVLRAVAATFFSVIDSMICIPVSELLVVWGWAGGWGWR